MEYLAARRVREWAEGSGWGARPELHAQVPHVEHLPADPHARGFWLALAWCSTSIRRGCRSRTTWCTEGCEALIDRAIGELGERFVSLREAGFYATKR